MPRPDSTAVPVHDMMTTPHHITRQVKADDAYVRGKFSDAADLYGGAIHVSRIKVNEDKWGRATLHANRAACWEKLKPLFASAVRAGRWVLQRGQALKQWVQLVQVFQ